MQDSVVHIIVLTLYLLGMLGIGFFFFKKNETQSDYLLGGRSLNPWVAALSAQASDMSGWLMMGLPGVAFLALYNAGLAEAFWTAIGLAVGTYLNWLLVAKRLRRSTEVYGNAITIPAYLENRFKENSKILRTTASIFIIVFFIFYTAAQFSAGAKLFNSVFGLDYTLALLIGVVIIVGYTFLGGFKAVCWTDLIQGLLMFVALILLAVVAFTDIGGVNVVNNTLVSIGAADHALTFSDFLGWETFGTLGIIGALGWGLGYFGQPHIIVRFMGIRKARDVRPARRIAMVWVVISLAAAVIIGVIGKAYLALRMDPAAFAAMDGEKVFVEMIKLIFAGPGLAIIGGVLITAILSAIMSTADSQLLVASSAVSEDIYHALFKKNAPPKQLMWISRIAVMAVAVIAAVIALDKDSSVFGLVSQAWAGFGGTFGPVILFSLFWKRMNKTGAIAGVISGGLTWILWQVLVKPHFGLYEIVPAFAVSVICIIVGTLCGKAPDQDTQDKFEEMLKPEEA